MRFLPLLQITSKYHCKLWQLYHKLRQITIKPCSKKLLQITVPLIQTTAESYYKLRHLYYKLQLNYTKNLLQITVAEISPSYWWSLPVALTFIKNYGNFQNYHKLPQACFTNYCRYYILRRYYKLHRKYVWPQSINFQFLRSSKLLW